MLRPRILFVLCLLTATLAHVPHADGAQHVVTQRTAVAAASTTSTSYSRTQLTSAITAVLAAKADADARFLAALPKPAPVVYVHSTSSSSGSHKGYATARECVSMTENGGDYGRSSNPSHFGRFQFSRSAWASFGGDPNTWGSASPAEQDAVFDTAWSQGPAVQQQQWLRWDGCG